MCTCKFVSRGLVVIWLKTFGFRAYYGAWESSEIRGSLENVGESLWESSFVCESKIRELPVCRDFDSGTTKEHCSVMLSEYFFNTGGERLLSEAVSVQIFPTLLILCSC